MPTNVENQDKKNPLSGSNEFDLGTALDLTLRGTKKLGSGLAAFFRWLGEVFLWGLIFLRKQILWIALAVAIGFGWGMYKSASSGNKYAAEMTARFNYGSGMTLYGTVEYLNGLISTNSLDTLGKIFSISPLSAASILQFSAEPVEDDLAAADLYRQLYLRDDRASMMRLDTFWARVVPFNDFKKNLAKYNIPLQKIKITANQADIFAKLQNGFVNEVSANAVLRKSAEIENGLVADEEKILSASLHGLDTLRTVYNDRLRNMVAGKEQANTSINMNDRSAPNPELELYDKMLLIKDELKQVREHTMSQQGIVQVYSPFSKFGRPADFFSQSSATYAMRAFVGILAVLLAIEMYKFLGRQEKKRAAPPVA